MMRLLCRLGWHRFTGPAEAVRDDSIARGYGGVVVLEAGYYRYHCTRCGVASDAGRA